MTIALADLTQAYTSLKQIAWGLQEMQFDHNFPPKPPPPPTSVLCGNLFHVSYYGGFGDFLIYPVDLFTSDSSSSTTTTSSSSTTTSDEDYGGDALFSDLDPTSFDVELFPAQAPPDDGVCVIL